MKVLADKDVARIQTLTGFNECAIIQASGLSSLVVYNTNCKGEDCLLFDILEISDCLSRLKIDKIRIAYDRVLFITKFPKRYKKFINDNPWIKHYIDILDIWDIAANGLTLDNYIISLQEDLHNGLAGLFHYYSYGMQSVGIADGNEISLQSLFSFIGPMIRTAESKVETSVTPSPWFGNYNDIYVENLYRAFGNKTNTHEEEQ